MSKIFSCDACHDEILAEKPRIACTICPAYHLCANCFVLSKTSRNHDSDHETLLHPMSGYMPRAPPPPPRPAATPVSRQPTGGSTFSIPRRPASVQVPSTTGPSPAQSAAAYSPPPTSPPQQPAYQPPSVSSPISENPSSYPPPHSDRPPTSPAFSTGSYAPNMQHGQAYNPVPQYPPPPGQAQQQPQYTGNSQPQQPQQPQPQYRQPPPPTALYGSGTNLISREPQPYASGPARPMQREPTTPLSVPDGMQQAAASRSQNDGMAPRQPPRPTSYQQPRQPSYAQPQSPPPSSAPAAQWGPLFNGASLSALGVAFFTLLFQKLDTDRTGLLRPEQYSAYLTAIGYTEAEDAWLKQYNASKAQNSSASGFNPEDMADYELAAVYKAFQVEHKSIPRQLPANTNFRDGIRSQLKSSFGGFMSGGMGAILGGGDGMDALGGGMDSILEGMGAMPRISGGMQPCLTLNGFKTICTIEHLAVPAEGHRYILRASRHYQIWPELGEPPRDVLPETAPIEITRDIEIGRITAVSNAQEAIAAKRVQSQLQAQGQQAAIDLVSPGRVEYRYY